LKSAFARGLIDRLVAVARFTHPESPLQRKGQPDEGLPNQWIRAVIDNLERGCFDTLTRLETH
jgi:hypothetical protein